MFASSSFREAKLTDDNCGLDLLQVSGFAKRGAQANALSEPPGEYGRKAKTQRN